MTITHATQMRHLEGSALPGRSNEHQQDRVRRLWSPCPVTWEGGETFALFAGKMPSPWAISPSCLAIAELKAIKE